MKKTILLVSVCFVLLFVGCSKDDNSDIKVNNFINTKWAFAKDTQGSSWVYMSVEFINENEVKYTRDESSSNIIYSYYNYTYLNNKATIIKKDTGEIIDVSTLSLDGGHTMTLDSMSDVFNLVD